MEITIKAYEGKDQIVCTTVISDECTADKAVDTVIGMLVMIGYDKEIVLQSIKELYRIKELYQQ